ncbi:BrnA antitoxin family protein [Rhizobium glycinendophyticum]|uniref:BrnA antitoxin family protein n=1 Tax=Rhizobium glycinendophyticum TaxID=2589807 RepID=A0A504UN10_9HYPH|nr:BrnA antitoxin family protein [Rhizobium glycinendophyticum]TPP12045.1 BrnA antitoxin family protein [Rhizobium glycinendophyticum]
MTVRKPKTDGFVEGRGYTRADWDEVSDNPEMTEAELRELRPFREVFPDLAASIDRKLGRPRADNPKKAISLRLDAEVIERFKATGDGWQSRMNEALRKAVGL